MPVCIYCLEDKPADAFNREHVLSQGFGVYEQNLTLGDVCLDCNGTMGREIETPGIRGSFEGIHRFLTARRGGVKSFLKTPRSRVSCEFTEPGLRGVQPYHIPSDDGEDVRVMFAPQVVADYHDGSYRAFRLADLTDRTPLATAVSFRAYAITDDELKALVDAMHRLGFEPKWSPIEMPDGTGTNPLVKISSVYDDITRRLMAKIAINYLAHVAGAHYVRKPDFDAIRRFIRHGVGRGDHFVRPVGEPMASEERAAGGNWSLTDEHLVGVSRDARGGIVGDVSIFNMIHNVVTLSRTNPDVIETELLPSGRRFNWRTHEIATLRGWARDNLVQPADAFRYRRRLRRPK